jgi:methylmalonyl-CoA mutase cobalamin-binding domain/chain
MKMIDQLEESIIDLDIEKAVDVCRKLVESSTVSPDQLFEAIGRALEIVGSKYEAGEYFLSELIMAGEVVKQILNVIEPIYGGAEREPIATVVLATVRGDLHDLGKNIFTMLLQSSGFRVVDLGVDVSAEKIIDAVRENGADTLGLSSLLTTTVPELENVVKELKKSGLREKVKVLVGGAAVNAEVAKRYGVDAWGKTAVEGLNICKQWFTEGGS